MTSIKNRIRKHFVPLKVIMCLCFNREVLSLFCNVFNVYVLLYFILFLYPTAALFDVIKIAWLIDWSIIDLSIHWLID